MTKIVKTDSTIAPASDFAQKIDEALRKSQEKPAERVVGECWAAFKYENGTISRCKVKGDHFASAHANGMIAWQSRCDSTAQGERCRYQFNHEGSHVDVREELTWTDEIPGLMSIGEALRDSPSFQKALAEKIAASRPVMQTSPIRKSRQYQIGFGPIMIPAGGRTTLTQALQLYFRGNKIINTGDVDGLYIEQIFAGTRAQLEFSTGMIGVGVFSPDSISEFRLDTVTPGLSLTMTVYNAATDPRRFSCVVIGKAVA